MRWSPEDGDSSPTRQELEPAHPQRVPDGRTAVIGSTRFEVADDEVSDFESARRSLTIAQVGAVLSLFFGGVALGVIALMFAFSANSKLNRMAMSENRSEEACKALRRSGMLAITVAAGAIVLNLLAISFLFPYIQQMLDGSVQGYTVPTPNADSIGTTTWG